MDCGIFLIITVNLSTFKWRYLFLVQYDYICSVKIEMVLKRSYTFYYWFDFIISRTFNIAQAKGHSLCFKIPKATLYAKKVGNIKHCMYLCKEYLKKIHSAPKKILLDNMSALNTCRRICSRQLLKTSWHKIKLLMNSS